MQSIFNISKRHLQKLALAKQKKPRTYIHFGNDKNQAQKSLIPTQKPNFFDYKHYKGKQILKFGFVCTRNNGDCGSRWSM